MRLNRFFSERINLRVGSSVKLPDSEINHIRKVLRLEKGDKIILFNGEKEFLAELRVVSREVIIARVLELLKEEDFSDESRVEITLVQGLLRAGKIDLIIKKTTELGIDTILPVEMEYSQSKADKLQNKLDRWNKLALAACKQSERIKVPDIVAPIKFTELMDKLSIYDKVYVFTLPKTSAEYNTIKLQKSDKTVRNIAYIIGPEGGFSPHEHNLLAKFGCEFVTLWNHILTSENAAISALAVLEYLYN